MSWRREASASIGAGDLVVDAAIPCEHVYRPMASRAFRRLVHSAGRDVSRPLAEFLGSRGYATAGFVANYWYCASDSGLGRGFAAYRDYIFPGSPRFKTAVLVDRPLDGLQAVEHFLEDWLDFDLLRPAVERLWWLFKTNRKEAAVVNREFLDWLSRRRQPERPFFAFLNYYDAHYPYQLPEHGHPPVRGQAAQRS